MKTKIAINGFGRIGRAAFKAAINKDDLEVVAINDLGEPENLAYLLKYDSAYGVYEEEVSIQEGELTVGEKKIKVLSEKDPAALPWRDWGVEVVLECTGVFKDRNGVSGHLQAGARKVVISAPTKDESIKTIVLGCNQEEITSEDEIVSMASCTTNCIAPIAKVLDEYFGVEKSLMSTIHSYTATQNLVDGPSKKDWRRGRAAAQNIVPSTTGAAIAATKTLPQLKGIFDGMAYRVPTMVGSISDLTAVLKKETTVEEVQNAFREKAKESLKGIMAVTEVPLVSHDIIGNSHSCIVQLDLIKVISKTLVKVVGWYDNEWGYSNRLVELAVYLARK
jgi:glyceraldehyde 3-phosphate dehydrogenase